MDFIPRINFPSLLEIVRITRKQLGWAFIKVENGKLNTYRENITESYNDSVDIL